SPDPARGRSDLTPTSCTGPLTGLGSATPTADSRPCAPRSLGDSSLTWSTAAGGSTSSCWSEPGGPACASPEPKGGFWPSLIRVMARFTQIHGRRLTGGAALSNLDRAGESWVYELGGNRALSRWARRWQVLRSSRSIARPRQHAIPT